MEENNRRRRPAEPLPLNTNQRYHQTVQNPQQQQQPQQQAHRTMAGTNSDRYRPAPLNTSPPSAGRAGLGAASTYNYYQDPATATGFSAANAGIPNTTMGFQQQPAPGYGADNRQTQNFPGGYGNTNMMYNVPQASAQSTSGVYDTSSQTFDIRQTAVPITDVTNTGYYPNEPTNAAAASAMQQQQQPSTAQSAAVYQQGSADNRNNLLNYPSNVPGSLGAMTTQGTSSATDVNMEESGEYQTNDLNQAYSQYQEALKEVAVNINRGYLAPAGESLRSVSDWLLSNVNELGLTSDDQTLHSDRIQLWNDFNHAWLGVFQMQRDLLESGAQLQRGQSLITEENLAKMMEDLIRHCDAIDRFGLVDYQYGVWEERISTIALECRDLMIGERPGAAAGSGR